MRDPKSQQIFARLIATHSSQSYCL